MPPQNSPDYPNISQDQINSPPAQASSQFTSINSFAVQTGESGGFYETTSTAFNIAGIVQYGVEYNSGTAVVGLYTDAATSSGLYLNSTFWGGNQYVDTMRISQLAHDAGPILFGATVLNDVYGAATQQVSPLEAGGDISAGYIGLVGGPVGAAVGVTYSFFHEEVNSTAAGSFQILTDLYYHAPLGPNFADWPKNP